MIPNRALKVAVDGGYQWSTVLQGRCVIRWVSPGWGEWDNRLKVSIEKEPGYRSASWQTIAKDDQFWECLARALNRYDEKALRADFEKSIEGGEKGYEFWAGVLH